MKHKKVASSLYIAVVLSIGFVVLFGALTPVQAGDGVSIELVGPAVPYDSVLYEVVQKHGAISVGVTKTFAAEFGHRSNVGLLSADDLEPLLKAFEADSIFELKTSHRPYHRTRYRIQISYGARTHRFEVDDPYLQLDLRYQRIIDRLRTVVVTYTDPIVFQDNLLLPNEAGRLRIIAQPTAFIEVDGLRWAGQTPATLTLPVGAYRIVLIPTEGGQRYDYAVKVKVGQITALKVDLK